MANRPYPSTIRPSNYKARICGIVTSKFWIDPVPVRDQDILKLASVRKLQQEKKIVIINDSGQEESIRSIS